MKTPCCSSAARSVGAAPSPARTPRLAFAGTGQPFEVAGAPLATGSLLAEANVGVRLRDEISLELTYSGQIAAPAQDHLLKGAVSVRF